MGRWKLGEGLPRAWGWGPRGPGLTGDFGALSSHGDPEESLGTEFMRPWHSCASEGPGPPLLAQRSWDERVPGPLSTFRLGRLGICRRILHALYTTASGSAWPSRGTCPASGPLLCLFFLPFGVGVGGAKLIAGAGRVGRGGGR